MDFIELARSRYSCKKFDPRQISKEQLDCILEAGRLAPTAKNLQEQHVYVVQSVEGLAKVDALTPCRYGAPTMLIVAFDKNNVFTYPGQKYDSGIEDATIVTTHMMLCAKSVGVDSCWVNFFDPDKMAEAFLLPENEEILTCLARSCFDYTQTPRCILSRFNKPQKRGNECGTRICHEED